MRIYKLLFTVLAISFSWDAISQQLPIFTQYRANRGYINPASLDFENIADVNLTFGASIRNQWVGLGSGPKTQTLYGTYVGDLDGFGLIAGGYLVNDEADRIGFTGLYGRIGGILTDDIENYGLSIGMNLGFVQYRVDLSDLDGTLDPLALGDQNQMNPDVGVGIFAYTSIDRSDDYDYFYGGISIPQVLGLDLTLKNANNQFSTERIRHYYGLIGYYLDMNDQYSFLEASAWVKYVPNIPVNVDFNLRYQVGEFIWLGGGFSTERVFHGEFGVTIRTNSIIKIGYGFDSPFSGISNYFGNTHEVNFSIAFDKY